MCARASQKISWTNNWYKSHINDEFVKLANKENWRSRAVYKLKEIDEKYDLISSNSKIENKKLFDKEVIRSGLNKSAGEVIEKTLKHKVSLRS